MRPVTVTDLCAAARVLLALPEAQRAAGMAALIARTEAADSHRRATGQAHPAYGNGTLLAAALAHPARDPAEPGARDYLACLALASGTLLAHGAGTRAPASGNSGAIGYVSGTATRGDAPCPRSSPD